ncbi:CocE/NonD hydrolase [Coniochaeta hoffmannii]|uniref:CocE/NonD hydrolase n=1 Tax=Coniochaeta hoffmannii TaxID=91930 RepID=A0AA38VGK5_9PEZI|nr:CocE/NonD hydrolase [Coniochaeta hoffmannii]
MATRAQERSLWAAITDRLAAWYLGLSAEKCSYTAQALKIPMKDGVELAADFYNPILTRTSRLSGLLLVQTCYGRDDAMAIFNARVYASRGYQVLFVSSRGTFGSGGQFDPGRNEQSDSRDIVAWMRAQPWYPGRFATAGASYLGYSQWALLHDPPQDCVAAVIPAGMHDLSRQSWGTGALLMQRIVWSDLIARQEDVSLGLWARVWALATARDRQQGLHQMLDGLPLLESVQRHFNGDAPWIEDVMTRQDLKDPYWAPTQHEVALERVDIPILLINGWLDLFSRQVQTFDQYRRLKERGCPVAFTVGPWSHVEACGMKTLPDMMSFLDSHVARNKAEDPLVVRIFVTGAQEWREMESWPPPTVPFTTYLHGDGSLGKAGLPADVAPSTFTYDPLDPTPTVEPGKDDKAVFGDRTDVLAYTSDPLEWDMEILGQPTVQLAHSSDIPFVDLVIRLSELDPATGVSRCITERFQALDPNRDATPLQLTLSDCAHRVKKGKSIRLTVAGGSFPLYARNLGTEGNRVLGSTTRPAKHTISYSGGLSYLTLPTSEEYSDKTQE